MRKQRHRAFENIGLARAVAVALQKALDAQPPRLGQIGAPALFLGLGQQLDFEVFARLRLGRVLAHAVAVLRELAVEFIRQIGRFFLGDGLLLDGGNQAVFQTHRSILAAGNEVAEKLGPVGVGDHGFVGSV
jgi:hypothetical protein